MTEARPVTGKLERWVTTGASIVAPVTVLSALLFYFGYVSSRSQYEYFGVDVDTVGLSTQDYIMRSPQPLLVPLLGLALGGVGLLTAHTAVRRRLVAGTDTVEKTLGVRRLVRLVHLAGVGALMIGVALLVVYPYVRDWAFYSLVTPLVIALGAGVAAYASWVVRLLDQPAQAAGLLRRVSSMLLNIVLASSVFWAIATIAQWSGRGLAQYDALHLSQLPSVILDTKERLFLHDPGVEETTLPASAGQTFHYRYRHLRLLIQGHDRMFLVPDTWSASDSTLVVLLDDEVRVQFQFVNEHP